MRLSLCLRDTFITCPDKNYNRKLLETNQSYVSDALFGQFHILYTFQVGFTLTNAPVLFLCCRNLVRASETCSSHGTLLHEHLLLRITTPNTICYYTKYFPNTIPNSNYGLNQEPAMIIFMACCLLAYWSTRHICLGAIYNQYSVHTCKLIL